MKLTVEQRGRVRAVMASESHSFAELVHASGLDRTSHFRGADLRNIDFATDDLSEFDFTRAHLEGANLAYARGLHRAKFDGARWNAATRGLLLRDLPDAPLMVLIPAGSFIMGVPPEESEREGARDIDNDARPQHHVDIDRPFLLGRYPVTRGQFAAFVKEARYSKAGSKWRKPRFEQTDDHPVVNVSRQAADAYAAWLSDMTEKDYRLPSEAEWEYAARAGTPTARYWGDSWDEASAYAHNEPAGGTAAAGSLRPNAFGLYDMLGNVFEWTADHWHDNYDGAPDSGLPWTTGDSGAPRVLRGGSWFDDPGSLRAGVRDRYVAVSRLDNAGFRLARTL
jgi:formylglycine-generating enzyme required for sulfatase activity